MEDQAMLWNLFETIQRRKRPEDVAHMVEALIGEQLGRKEASTLGRAARGSVKSTFSKWTSMMQDFARPVGMERQVRVAEELFGVQMGMTAALCSDPEVIEDFLKLLNLEIGKQSDYKYDRLNRAGREIVGLGEMSKRRYNKLFRLLGRMEGKLRTLLRETQKYEFSRIGKSGLATRLEFETFASNVNSAEGPFGILDGDWTCCEFVGEDFGAGNPADYACN